jgi:hypothetical protein
VIGRVLAHGKEQECVDETEPSKEGGSRTTLAKDKEAQSPPTRKQRRAADHAMENSKKTRKGDSAREKYLKRMKARALVQMRSREGFILKVRDRRNSWGPSWGDVNRALGSQRAFADFLPELDPHFVCTLWAPRNSSEKRLLDMLRKFRNSFHELYPRKKFPHRADRRKPEFIAALEYGLHPGMSRRPLRHLHVYLFEAAGMDPARMRKVWRRIANFSSKSHAGCHVRKFRRWKKGRGYNLKTWGTTSDRIVLSDKLRRPNLYAPKERALKRGWPRKPSEAP